MSMKTEQAAWETLRAGLRDLHVGRQASLGWFSGSSGQMRDHQTDQEALGLTGAPTHWGLLKSNKSFWLMKIADSAVQGLQFNLGWRPLKSTSLHNGPVGWFGRLNQTKTLWETNDHANPQTVPQAIPYEAHLDYSWPLKPTQITLPQ